MNILNDLQSNDCQTIKGKDFLKSSKIMNTNYNIHSIEKFTPNNKFILLLEDCSVIMEKFDNNYSIILKESIEKIVDLQTLNKNEHNEIQLLETMYQTLINTKDECESKWGKNINDDDLYSEYLDSIQCVEDFLILYEQLFIDHSVQY